MKCVWVRDAGPQGDSSSVITLPTPDSAGKPLYPIQPALILIRWVFPVIVLTRNLILGPGSIALHPGGGMVCDHLQVFRIHEIPIRYGRTFVL